MTALEASAPGRIGHARPTVGRQAAPAADGSPLAGRDLLTIGDLPPAAVPGLLDEAARLASARGRRDLRSVLAGRSVALLFERPSLRTRVSFELAVRELGGEAVVLSGAEIGLGGRESAADVARTLDRYVDAIVARIVRHPVLEEMAAASRRPVVNALTDREHPCQALADLLTLRARFGRLTGLRLAWVGDPNNVFRSLAPAASALGIDVRIAHPADHPLDPALASIVRDTTDPAEAVAAADAVYTDVWVSIGDEDADERRRAFAGYTVDGALLRHAAPHVVALHCLPAHRGDEISADVLDGPRSLAWDQAANRLPVQQAVLAALLAG